MDDAPDVRLTIWTQFAGGRDATLAALHRAKVVAWDETGIRIEGTNRFQWVFRCAEAVVHHVAPTRAASVVRDVMGQHRPDMWLSNRYSAQQEHGKTHQTCLTHFARDVAYGLDSGDEALALGLKLWLGAAFALAEVVTTLAASTIAASGAPWSGGSTISSPGRRSELSSAPFRTRSAGPTISFLPSHSLPAKSSQPTTRASATSVPP